MDLCVLKDVSQQRCLINFAPVLKPTALMSSISIFSGHPTGVHVGWMRSYVFNVYGHATQRAWADSFKVEILNRLIASGVDRSIVDEIDRTTQCTFKVDLPVSRSLKRLDKHTWLRFPYHSVWSGCINDAFRSFSRLHREYISRVMGSDGLRAAWALESSALLNIVRKI